MKLNFTNTGFQIKSLNPDSELDAVNLPADAAVFLFLFFLNNHKWGSVFSISVQQPCS